MARLDFLRGKLPMFALIALYLYIGYHALSGSQGLVSWMDNVDRAERLSVRLERLEAEREALQAEVDRLASRSLDLDTLDIEARRTLFVARPDEITIWLDP